jgi:rare lipoprotein A (peptidoglycan hydrolase)
VTVYTFTGAKSGQDYGSITSYDGGAGADAAAANGGVVGTIPSGAYGISLTGAGNIGYSLDGGGSGSEGSPLTVIGGLIRTGIVTAPEVSWGTPYQIASSTGQVVAPTAWRPFSGSATHYNIKNGKTAWGQPFNPNCMCAATYQKGIPKNGQATVTLQNDPSKSINVTVNDTGPFERGPDNRALIPLRADPNTVIDLTDAAFRALSGGDMGIGRLDVIVTPR